MTRVVQREDQEVWEPVPSKDCFLMKLRVLLPGAGQVPEPPGPSFPISKLGRR